MGAIQGPCRLHAAAIVSLILGCGGSAHIRAATPNTSANSATDAVDSPATDESPDPSTLSPGVRAQFESRRIDVIPTENGSYAFKDSLGWVTEGSFVRRYREITAAKDLDGSPAGTPLIVLGAIVIAGGLIGTVALVSSSQSQNCSPSPGGLLCFPNQNSPPLAGELAFSAVGLAGAGLIALGMAENQKGHRMTQARAEVYAARYNRALLRKLVDDEARTPVPATSGTPGSGEIQREY